MSGSGPPRRGRPPIYPWDEWFDGQVHVLQQGVDFTPEPYVMQRAIGVQARRRGLPIATRRIGGGRIEIGPRDHGFASNT